MPYPRFTKAIILYFMTQHKSISIRQGSPYHTVNNDEVLDRINFINKGDIYQVYGKPIPNTWITNEIKKSKAYKMYFKYSTGLIPPKKGRVRGARGTKATDAPKQINIVRKKTTDSSKKKQLKRKLVLHDESEGEPQNRPTGRKKRITKAVVIQEPPSVPVKKTQVSSGKLKGIKLLSDATRLEIDTCRAIKASKRESIFQHQTGGLSEGAGLRLEVPDELTGKYSDKGAEEKPEDIPWVSTDDDKSKNNEEEDDKSIDIEMTDVARTNIDVEDQVKGVVEMTITEEAKKENTERIEEQRDDEELKADEEQKGDDQAGDEQVVVPVSTTQKETPNLLQSTSSHSFSFKFAVKSVVQRFTELEQAVKELKQVNHSIAILASIKSQVPSVVKDYLGSSLPDAFQKNFLPKFLPQAVKEALEKSPLSLGQSFPLRSIRYSSSGVFFKYELKKILYEKMHKSHSNLTHVTHQELFDVLAWSMLLDETNMEKGDKPDSVPKKRDRGDDHDEDPSAGSNQEEPVKELVFEKALDDVEQTFDDKIDTADETQADVIPKISKKDWFKDSPKPEVLDPD
ncbi:hypothetical protein Tco_1395251 [Tanacetum coccineum]